MLSAQDTAISQPNFTHLDFYRSQLLRLPQSRVLDVAYALSLALLAYLLVAPLLVITYLPLGDLPDHAAQMRVLQDYEHYSQDYRINWFTPYWMGYGLALFFASFVSIVTAIKLVMSLSMLAVVVACYSLIRSVNGSRYWLWFCFTIAYSFSFYWGFFSYAVATPVAIAFLAYAVRYAQNPLLLKSALWAAVFSLLLFLAHALAWVLSVALAAAIVFIFNNWRDTAKKSMVFLAIIPLVIYWGSLQSPGASGSGIETGHLLEHIFNKLDQQLSYIVDMFSKRGENSGHLLRLKELFSFSIGFASLWDFVFIGALVCFWPLLLGAGLTRNWRRWLPVIVTFLAFMVVPYWIFDTAYIYQRFSVFLLPMLLLIYERPDHKRFQQAPLRTLALFASGFALVALVMLSNVSLFKSFEKDDDDFKAILAEMEEGKIVLSLMFDQDSELRFSPPYMHYSSWYQAEKGGQVMPSFTHSPSAKNVPVRYRGDFWVSPDPWNPEQFNWRKHKGERYDYFLVRASDSKQHLFRYSSEPVQFLAQHGKWQLYANAGVAGQ